MKEIKLEELKSIQLDILSKLHEFCQSRNLTYFLAGGTLIGAVRHKGYIPWDDDIDVLMPRKDYDKLTEIFNKENKDFKIFTSFNNKNYNLPFAKLCNVNTVLQEKSGVYNKKDFYINIDIFPYDFLPEDKDVRLKLFKKINFYRNALDVKNIKISKTRSFKRNFLLVLLKICVCFYNKHYLAQKIEKLISYQKEETSECACLVGVYKEKEIMKKEVFKEVVPAKFENYEFYIPKDYNSYLSSLYGDYLKLPPKEKQVSHHVFKAYWR